MDCAMTGFDFCYEFAEPLQVPLTVEGIGLNLKGNAMFLANSDNFIGGYVERTAISWILDINSATLHIIFQCDPE